MKTKKVISGSILLISIFLLFNSFKKVDNQTNFGNRNETVICKDADGIVYKTVKIGNQIWMAENLRTTKYRNGNPIPNVTDANDWSQLTTGAYCDYENQPDNSYGKLYNAFAVNDPRSIAPKGWHVPTGEEWKILLDYLGGENIAGGKLKETGTTHWESPNTGATNESGFSALPCGLRYGDGGQFLSRNSECLFWTTTSSSGNVPRSLRNDDTECPENIDSGYQTSGCSVRCVKD
jgi:uncharacterized protein (TIGR02145 family)